ncbi:MAG TPA: DUF6503 family protein [Thermoanaerobaculia bacterium]|nr:DUF6503 family protein [Thermoanaerobaculia bacterium]
MTTLQIARRSRAGAPGGGRLLAAALTGAAALAVAAALVAPAALAAAEPPKQERLEIVDRAIRHHGFDHLPELEVSLTVSSRSGSFDVVARPGDLFDYTVISELAGKRRVHRHANDLLRVTVDGEEQPLATEDDRRRARDFVSQRIYFLFLPHRLNDPSVYKQDLGLERWGQRDLHRVKVTFEPGTSTSADSEFLFWFDPETAELVQFAYSFDDGIRFRRAVDLRRVGGLLVYDQTNDGVDDPDADIDDLDFESVRDLRRISEVELRDVVVRPR